MLQGSSLPPCAARPQCGSRFSLQRAELARGSLREASEPFSQLTAAADLMLLIWTALCPGWEGLLAVAVTLLVKTPLHLQARLWAVGRQPLLPGCAPGLGPEVGGVGFALGLPISELAPEPSWPFLGVYTSPCALAAWLSVLPGAQGTTGFWSVF